MLATLYDEVRLQVPIALGCSGSNKIRMDFLIIRLTVVARTNKNNYWHRRVSLTCESQHEQLARPQHTQNPLSLGGRN